MSEEREALISVMLPTRVRVVIGWDEFGMAEIKRVVCLDRVQPLSEREVIEACDEDVLADFDRKPVDAGGGERE